MSKVKAEKRVVRVGLDKSGAEVVKLDQEGYFLSFKDEPDDFRELVEEEIKALSFDNQRSYWLAYAAMKQRKEVKEAGGAALVGDLKPVTASASTRMRLEFKDPKFHEKWVERWIRPDEVQEMSYLGYVPMDKKELKVVFSTTPGTVPTIADGRGNVEMLLWKCPVEIRKKRRASEKEQTVGALKRIKDTVSERLEKIADQVTPRAQRESPVFIEPSENDGHSWHEEPGRGSDEKSE